MIDVDNVNQLLKEATRKKSCCFGHCPDWIWRYSLGKKLANKKRDLEKFNQEGRQYIQLERIATLPSNILDFPSEKYLNFESREYAYKQLMEALKDDEVAMIGLYGMGGCAKTTLAMEVRKIAEAEHLFDKVLFVAVSSTVEVQRIQEKIASSMQYPFPENEERERAQRLCERFIKVKKILIILDDVWEKLYFGDIGIPSIEQHKGCKVLITTRSEEVCTSMDCQKRIQLQILTDEESWALFQKQARISEGTSDTLKHLAREISDECKGLPVAIAAVASSLKGKNEVIWKATLNKLRSSKPINVEKGLPNPYKCLQLSYDNLDTEEAKSFFLLCSVFPEDSEIPIEILTRIAIGLGVAGEVRSYEEARSEVIETKIKLVSSCLLLDADDECFKMHDLVRDVAHLIAKNENRPIKCILENDVTLEHNSIRYLCCEKFPNDLDCSNLEFLFLYTKFEVLDEIFKTMGKLKVLFIGNDQYRRGRLSTMSLKTLTNLRCLILVNWKLSDVSFISDMKKLESLALFDCYLNSFLELENDGVVAQLTNLKSLMLRNCEMERNNFDVVGRIPQLEELCIINKRKKWDHYDENTIEFFNTFSVSKQLKWYIIKLGSLLDDDDDDDDDVNFLSNERTLLLSCFDISNEAIMGLAKKAKVLSIANVQGGTKNIVPNIFQLEGGSIHDLNKLQICSSKEIECLVDTSNHHVSEVGILFSKLLKLELYNMGHLRVLWHGCLPPSGPFEKLEKLYLSDCPQLTSFFTHAIAQSPVPSTIFQNLQEVEIRRCRELKYVFSANNVGGLPQLKMLKIKYCNQLDQIIEDIVPSIPVTNYPLALQDEKQALDEIIEDEQHRHFLNPYFEANQLEIVPESTSIPSGPLMNHSSGSFALASLTSLMLESCPKLGSLFTTSTAKTLTSLEELTIEDCHGLKHILTRERVHKNQNENIVEDDQDFQSDMSMFRSLKRLYINRCDLLQHIFSISLVRDLVKLKDIKDDSCHLQQKNIQIRRPVSLGLEELVLYNLPQVTYVWVASKNSFTLQYLQTLEIVGCAKLEVIFPLSVLRCLPELKSLVIRDCKELKQIMEEEMEDKKLSNLLSTQPCFPKLERLTVKECHKLKRLFSVSASNDLPNLKFLMINGAAELEELIGCEQGASKNSFTLQNLKTLEIVGCAKLEVIFPPSVLICLPKLKRLEIKECDELKQIIEEDKKLSNLVSPQPCFPKLAALVVEQCHKLKRFFSVSAFNNLSNLKVLIINGAAELEELIGSEQGKGDIGKVKIDFPKLNILIFMGLSNLGQGTELLTVKHRIVHNCPKLSLTSTATTLQEIHKIFIDKDFKNISRAELYELIVRIITLDEDPTSSGTSELLSSQIHEKSEKEFIGNVSGSEVQATATSTNSKLNERPSPSPLDICQRETHSKDLVDGQSTSGKPLGETESNIGIPQEQDPMPENTSPFQMNPEDPSTSKSKPPSSQVNDNNQSVLGSIAEMVHEHKQIESGAPVSETDEFHELKRESERTSQLESLEKKLSPISSPNMTELVDEESSNEADFPDQHALGEAMNMEEIGKESIQEEPVSEGATVKTSSAGVDSISLGSGVATHESSDRDILAKDSHVVEQDDKLNESKTRITPCKKIQNQEGSNLMDKKEGLDIVSNNSIEVPPDTRTRLGAYKPFIDLDDAHLSLLEEAIAAYPHLWNACEKFSERFQAWMLKTLADMLFFLRNESAISVTPQREKEFHKLCDEAVQLGFERSWVDEMRQRVVARDPELDRAQARIGELLKKHDHLTQELHNIQKELKSLNDFVDVQTKCFNFL